MENITGKYIGENKIQGIGSDNKKTILGNNIIKIVFDNAEVVEYLEDILPTIVTEEKSNASDLQNNFNNYLVKKVLEVLVDSGIKIVDINPLLDKISNSISMNVNSVGDILWGKDLYKRTLWDVQKFLNDNTTTGKGEGEKNNAVGESEGSESPSTPENKI